MRIRTLVRTSSALPALPLAIGVAILFYKMQTYQQIAFWPYPYAPTLVEQPLELMYAISYALVSAASAWQGARLKESGVWQLAPYRTTRWIIARALSPIVGVGWLMLLVPVAMAFVQRPTWPTLNSLPPLVLGMLLCAAHAVIGVTIGQRLKPALAVPILSCIVFVLVAYPHSMQPFYLRHIMGEYFGHIGFGETATFASMLALFLPTAGVAAAFAFSWTRFHVAARTLVAAILVFVPTFTAYTMTKNWNYNPSINTGNVDIECTGSSPQVCLPAQASGSAKGIRSAVSDAYTILNKYGISNSAPTRIYDAMIYGRFTPANTKSTKYIWLSTAYKKNSIASSIINSYVHFPCEHPAPQSMLTLAMWLDGKTGRTPTYAQISAEDPYYTLAQHRETTKTVDEISTKSTAEQSAWYRSTVTTACEGSR